MTQEDKKLLLVDLSARLTYNVVIRCTGNDTNYNCFLTTDILNELLHNIEYYNYKPYLRPLSSMTEEECKELGELPATIENVCETLPNIPYCIEVARSEQLDWLNSHHFDYRNLIEKGLALEATEGMYNLEKK